MKLLKILLSQPGDRFTTEKLLESLWPDEVWDEENRKQRSRELNARIGDLRKILEPDIQNGHDSRFIEKTTLGNPLVRFNCHEPDCWIDTAAFQKLYEQGKSLCKNGTWPDAQRLLQQVTDLYRGDFLEEDLYEDWSIPYRSVLRDICFDSYSLLSDCYAHQGLYFEATECCDKAIHLIPDRSGEIQDKAKQYRDKRNGLGQRQAAAPLPRTQNVETASTPEKIKSKRDYALLAYGALAFLLIGAGFVYTTFFQRENGPKESPSPPESEIKYYFNDEGAFLLASNFPPVMVDFDELKPGTDLTGRNINGVRFEKSSPSAAAPIVADTRSTITSSGYRCEPLGDSAEHKLYASTGGMALSPGGNELAPGPNPALEDDDLVLVFEKPVQAVGLQVLWQAATGSERTLMLYGSDGKVLLNRKFSLSNGTPGVAAPAGSAFVGAIAPGKLISKVVIDETDNDNCLHDSNAGYDTIRFRLDDVPAKKPTKEYVFDRQWGIKGSNPGEFNDDLGPRGLAIVDGEAPRIFVADYINYRIQSFDLDGRLLGTYPLGRWTTQELEYDGKDALYVRAIVNDKTNMGLIAKFDLNMNVIWQREVPAAEWVAFGLCIDSEGNIHVPAAPSTLQGEIHMMKFDPDGNLLSEYGYGIVSGAARCAATPDGYLYVQAQKANLRKFDLNGNLMDTYEFGAEISGLSVDPSNNHIYLAEKILDHSGHLIPKVREYDRDFNLVAEWGASGTGNGAFSDTPEEIELGPDGKIYISDGHNYMIQVFRPK